MTDEKIRKTDGDADERPAMRVLGVLEKRRGKLMCGHGHEGAASLLKLPEFPSRDLCRR